MLDENSLISPRNWAISHIVADSGTVYRGQQVRIRTCCHRCTAARYHLLPEAPLWCDIDRNSSRQLRLFDQVRLACQRHYYSPRTASCRQRTYLAHGAVVPSRQHEGQLMAETSVQRPATSAYAALRPVEGRPVCSPLSPFFLLRRPASSSCLLLAASTAVQKMTTHS